MGKSTDKKYPTRCPQCSAWLKEEKKCGNCDIPQENPRRYTTAHHQANIKGEIPAMTEAINTKNNIQKSQINENMEPRKKNNKPGPPTNNQTKESKRKTYTKNTAHLAEQQTTNKEQMTLSRR